MTHPQKLSLIHRWGQIASHGKCAPEFHTLVVRPGLRRQCRSLAYRVHERATQRADAFAFSDSALLRAYLDGHVSELEIIYQCGEGKVRPEIL